MTTKRTPINRQHRPSISAEAVALYQHILCLSPDTREYSDRCSDLDELFDRRPWHESIMGVSPFMEAPSGNDDHDIAGAIEIRRALAALAQPT